MCFLEMHATHFYTNSFIKEKAQPHMHAVDRVLSGIPVHASNVALECDECEDEDRDEDRDE